MCHTKAKRFYLPIFLLLTGLTAQAQSSNKENAPYSRYGLGEFRNGNNTILKGMGNITSAYANPFAVNSANPASYAFLRLTTYEAGGEASTRTLFAANQSYQTGMATVSYMTIGIPLGKHGGMAFGLKPYSRTYYRINDTSNIPGLGRTISSRSGDGGVNYAYIGGAGKYGGFSLGFNFGYMFGTTRLSSVMELADTVRGLNSEFSRYTTVGGIYWNGGAMYETKLNKNMGLRVGGTIALSQNLRARRDEYNVAYRYLSGGTLQDTAINVFERKGEFTMPMTYSFGAQLYGNEKWMAGIDISTANWSQFRNFGMLDSVTDNSFKLGVGGEYTPNAAAMRQYLARITYRIGAYYGKDYIRLNGTDINYYAITVGASLPFKRSADRIHTSLEIGKRGTETNGLIRENFVRFGLGVTLNDKWFIKRRYD